MTSHHMYPVGRKVLIATGVSLIALSGFLQSREIIGVNLRASDGPAAILKELPIDKFQLKPKDAWSLNMRNSLGVEYDALFHGAVSANRQIKDNLKWNGRFETKYQDKLEWHRFGSSPTTSKKRVTASQRVLIAQFSNRGHFEDIFRMTKPVNLGYAKNWGHDIVFLDGTKSSSEDVNISTLLGLAWEKRQNYDQVVLLDADAMIDGFRQDISILLENDQMVALKTVEESEKFPTESFNGAVSIWNLKHLLVPRVQSIWSARYEEKDSRHQSLRHQLLPYRSEILDITAYMGDSRRSFIKTLATATSKHGKLKKLDKKALIAQWKILSRKACQKNGLKCKN